MTPDEDAMQEAWARTLAAGHVDPSPALLRTAAVRYMIDEWRKDRRNVPLADWAPDHRRPVAEVVCDRDAVRHILGVARDELPLDQRKALDARFVRDCDWHDVAWHVGPGRSAEAARALVVRAVRTIRTALRGAPDAPTAYSQVAP